ncbi:hypothetical protein AB0M80_28520 [Amycolatopsis sp. NPDC051045]|uniref:hypothetical protein n=1 Tax=Amycolatopsis sp. NPDC051045 TaxID=3156922 RepID=UPI003424CC4D
MIASIPPSHLIAINQHLTEAEQERARAAKSGDPRIGRALTASEGFAEYLAAGTPMLQRWSIGDSPLFYVGQAVISAAVDCRRAGYAEAVPSATLAELCRSYLAAPWCDRPDLPPVSEGLAWAARPVLGASSCLQPRSDGAYLASDYLVDQAQEGTSPLGGSPIPDSTWDTLFSLSSDQGVTAIGMGAYRAGRFEVAEKCFRRASEAGDSVALGIVAIVIGKMGRFSQLKEMFHDAAQIRHGEVMVAAAATLSANSRFGDLSDLAREAIRMADGVAGLALAGALSARGQWETLEALAAFAIDHNQTGAILSIMAVIAPSATADHLTGLLHHAIDSDSRTAIAATLLYLEPRASSLLEYAERSGQKKSATVILEWAEARGVFAE